MLFATANSHGPLLAFLQILSYRWARVSTCFNIQFWAAQTYKKRRFTSKKQKKDIQIFTNTSPLLLRNNPYKPTKTLENTG